MDQNDKNNKNRRGNRNSNLLGAGKLVAKSLLAAYSRSGASLAVALYLYVFEEGNFQVGYAIALVLLVLVTAINLAAKWARKALKQKT